MRVRAGAVQLVRLAVPPRCSLGGRGGCQHHGFAGEARRQDAVSARLRAHCVSKLHPATGLDYLEVAPNSLVVEIILFPI